MSIFLTIISIRSGFRDYHRLFFSERSIQWELAKQMGINHAVIRLPESAKFDETSQTHWRSVYDRFISAGLTPLILEPMPDSLHGHIKKGDGKRDECIEKVIKMMGVMDKLNVRTICFNFMAHIGWLRTQKDIKERGAAKVTGFNIDDFIQKDDFTITSAELWLNLEYFLKAVMPYAERYGIKLALHPDDPPVEQLGGISRILTSFENTKKAISIVESDYIGVTMCQATYALMGEDLEKVIPSLASDNKIFFVHFRDISGNRFKFRETFHDNGQTNMARMVQLYKAHNVNVPVRVDHVPTMAGEDNTIPGYGGTGRLFAIGYLKGLLDFSELN